MEKWADVPQPEADLILLVSDKHFDVSDIATHAPKAAESARNGKKAGHGVAVAEPPPRPQKPTPFGLPAEPLEAASSVDDGEPPRSVSRWLWFGAVPLGFVSALAIFLFIGWLQPSIGGGERITLPTLVQFKVAKQEPPPPPPPEQQQAERPKQKARRRPTAARRSALRSQVAARPTRTAGFSSIGMVPSGASMEVNLDFDTRDLAIKRGGAQDKEVVDRARRRQSRRMARDLSFRSGAASQALSQFTKPRLINHCEPEYPEHAKQKEVEGEVVVKLFVSMLGNVDEIEFLSAEPSGYFEESVRNAVSRWSFAPAKDDMGNPVGMWERARLVFKLEGS